MYYLILPIANMYTCAPSQIYPVAILNQTSVPGGKIVYEVLSYFLKAEQGFPKRHPFLKMGITKTFLALNPKLANRLGARGSGGVHTFHCYFLSNKDN